MFPTIDKATLISQNGSLNNPILSTEELVELGTEALTALLMRLNKEMLSVVPVPLIQFNRNITESPSINGLFNNKQQFITMVPYADPTMASAKQSLKELKVVKANPMDNTNWEILLYYIIESHLKIMLTPLFSGLTEAIENKQAAGHVYHHEEAFLCIKLWIFGHIAYQRYLNNVDPKRDYSSFIQEFLTRKNGWLNNDEGFLLNKKSIMASITHDMIEHFSLRKEHWENKLKNPSWLDKMVYTHFLALKPELKSSKKTIISHTLRKVFK